MDLMFHEKSNWLMFVSLVVCFALYFTGALIARPPGAVDVMPQHVVFFTLAVVLLVIMQIVGHILIAIVDRRSETDERDRLIELKGMRNGGYVLAIGVCTSLCVAIVTKGNFIFTHVLLAFWVVAQFVEIGSQLYHYRRGV